MQNETGGRVVDAINAGKGYVGEQLGWQGDKGFEGDDDYSALAIALEGCSFWVGVRGKEMDAWLCPFDCVYGYSVLWEVFLFHLAIRHGSNTAGWSCANPGLEQCRGRALLHLTSLGTALHSI